jgi:hypothetical protein
MEECRQFGVRKIGMKGVSPEVSAVRNNIKNKIFFPKDVAIEKTSQDSPDYNVQAAILGRGRVPRTNSDPVIGFASKAMAELAKTGPGKPKAKELGALAEKVKQLRTDLDDVQREMLGLAKLTKKQRAELGAAELKKLDDKLANLKSKEEGVVARLTSTSAAALKIMKEVGPQIGLSEEGKETGGGIGADDGSGNRDDVVKPDPHPTALHGQERERARRADRCVALQRARNPLYGRRLRIDRRRSRRHRRYDGEDHRGQSECRLGRRRCQARCRS